MKLTIYQFINNQCGIREEVFIQIVAIIQIYIDKLMMILTKFVVVFIKMKTLLQINQKLINH
jgi:hypothetical protein